MTYDLKLSDDKFISSAEKKTLRVVMLPSCYDTKSKTTPLHYRKDVTETTLQ